MCQILSVEYQPRNEITFKYICNNKGHWDSQESEAASYCATLNENAWKEYFKIAIIIRK